MAAETSFRAARIARYLAARRPTPRPSPTALVAALNYTFAVCVAVILWGAPRELQRIAAVVVLVTVVPAVVWMRQMLTRAGLETGVAFLTRLRGAEDTPPSPAVLPASPSRAPEHSEP